SPRSAPGNEPPDGAIPPRGPCLQARMTSVIERLHQRGVYGRRVRVLVGELCQVLPPAVAGTMAVLDIGCGDGLIARLLMERRPDLRIEGIDVLARPGAHIPVTLFDGSRIPRADEAVDVALLVDVLHHADEPMALLREAFRVARST